MGYKTVEEYLEYFNTQRKRNQVGIGIVIENYSKYDLKFPQPTFHNKGRQIHRFRLRDVDSQTSALFILDNHETYHRGVHGAVSWQVMNGPETGPTSKRLIIGFEVYHG